MFYKLGFVDLFYKGPLPRLPFFSLLSYTLPVMQMAYMWNPTDISYTNSLKAAPCITGFSLFWGGGLAMTKLWEKPPFSYTVKENVGGETGLSGSKSFSTWVLSGNVAKRKEEDSA